VARRLSMGGGLTELSAGDAARLIKSRRISSSELVEACLARIQETDQRLKAWEIVNPVEARRTADRRDVQLRDSDAVVGKLHGVPFGVKDVIDVDGFPTKAGFTPFASRRARTDSAVVESLKRAGAVVLGKTATAQFAYADPPDTVNPWSADHTPGGSSSGSAAAVAARQVPIALATQTGGSTLRPAAFTACIGFKPSYGLVETSGVLPLAWSLDHVGMIARSVEDCALFVESTVGQSMSASDTGSPRLGVLEDATSEASAEVRTSFISAVGRLADAGAVLSKVSLPFSLDEVVDVHGTIMQAEAAAAHWHLFEEHPDDYGPLMRSFIKVGKVLPAGAYIQAQRLRRRVTDAVAAATRGVDALVLATVGSLPPGRETTGDSKFQAIFTLTGFPAITLPTGLSDQGLPLAIQLSAALRHDAALLAVAEWCSQVLGPCPSPAS
jgi:Asp-tRNA(Asn)/Glu-tRNA(Gln) amidotransferase A subunit family amidase